MIGGINESSTKLLMLRSQFLGLLFKKFLLSQQSLSQKNEPCKAKKKYSFTNLSKIIYDSKPTTSTTHNHKIDKPERINRSYESQHTNKR
jgi:hypothetical protein